MIRSKGFNKGKLVAAFAVSAVMLASSAIAPHVAYAAESDTSDASVSKYTTDYDSWQDTLDAAAELNEQIGAEGFVLLKNEKSNLPFGNSVRNISLFGKNSVNPVYSGSGSSGGTSGNTVSIEQSLKDAGFRVNPTLLSFYNNNELSGQPRSTMSFSSYNYHSYFATAETPQSKYTQEVKDSYADYNDAAVVVLSRTGGEGTDLPRTSLVTEEYEGKVPSADDARAFPTREEVEFGGFEAFGGEGRENTPWDHYLELDENEEALLDEVTAKFDKVVVVLNSSNVMELSPEFMNNEKIQSVIWAPGAGQNGFAALGKILNGQVNPSGRTSDTFPAVFENDPTWNNFGNNNVGYYGNQDAGNLYTLEDGTIYNYHLGLNSGVAEVSYEEGIYLGYKYYETRGYTDGEDWYSSAVNYPFGYGLSYTTFDWEVGEVKLSTETLTAKTVVSVDVKVTNVGGLAGKDVVQAYFSAPYTDGETEKAHVVLGGFEKTKELAPGESQTVTVSFDAFDMASFDAYDKDKDGHKGYELDAGDYKLYVGKNAHDAWTDGEERLIASLDQNLSIDEDPVTGAEITSLFQTSTDEMEGRTLSRSDWEGTWPTTPLWYTEEGEIGGELVKSEEWLSNFDMPIADDATADNAIVESWYDEENPRYDGGEAPWYSATAPAFRAESEAYSADNPAPIQLKDMAGIPLDDERWDEFVSQLTVDQAYEMMAATRFQFNAQDAVGSPVGGHSDGPLGITGAWVGGGNSLLKPIAASYKFSFATEVLVACTWNKDIAYKQGNLIGNIGLWSHVIGTYAPAANIHRSPFSGRNFEYYSEDATLSGYMVANVVKGEREKGLVTFMKHFALNDQETNRDTNSIATWADEQTMRENYFKAFEWAVKDGGSNGAMSAFNRIGFDWCGASYELLTGLLRNEWGFEGVVITDAHGSGYGSMNANQMLRAGNDMSLDSGAGSIARVVNSDESNTATQLTALHNSMKNIFYTVLNSAAMNNGYEMENIAYNTPATTTFNVKAGSAVNVSVADGAQGDQYVIMLGSLPKGLEFDGKTGAITGTVAGDAEGTYTIQVAKTQKGVGAGEQYIVSTGVTAGFGSVNGLQSFTFNVEKVYQGEDFKVAYAGHNFVIDASIDEEGATYALVNASDFSGVTIDAATGAIRGNISASGTYTLTVQATVGETTYTYDITVAVADGIGEGVTIVNISKVSSEGNVDTYVITFSDNSQYTFTITNGTDGADGADGTNGTNGSNGTNGIDGADGKDGKDASAGTGIAAICVSAVALVAAAAAIVLLIRKKS